MPCLVLARAPGVIPEDVEGWRRMGLALARLHAVPWQGSGLRAYDAETFAAAHSARVRELAPALPDRLRATEAWRAVADRPAALGEIVLTHGDPGPGNFLHDGADGCLIDFEAAHAAPRGLDLARAVFIALLGSGPEGFVARDHSARARAVAEGYLQAVAARWRPTQNELRWWLAVAAVQFAHERHRRVGQPGVRPAEEPIQTLARVYRASDWCPG